jgi:hypothetical protein
VPAVAAIGVKGVTITRICDVISDRVAGLTCGAILAVVTCGADTSGAAGGAGGSMNIPATRSVGSRITGRARYSDATVSSGATVNAVCAGLVFNYLRAGVAGFMKRIPSCMLDLLPFQELFSTRTVRVYRDTPAALQGGQTVGIEIRIGTGLQVFDARSIESFESSAQHPVSCDRKNVKIIIPFYLHVRAFVDNIFRQNYRRSFKFSPLRYVKRMCDVSSTQISPDVPDFSELRYLIDVHLYFIAPSFRQ